MINNLVDDPFSEDDYVKMPDTIIPTVPDTWRTLSKFIWEENQESTPPPTPPKDDKIEERIHDIQRDLEEILNSPPVDTTKEAISDLEDRLTTIVKISSDLEQSAKVFGNRAKTCLNELRTEKNQLESQRTTFYQQKEKHFQNAEKVKSIVHLNVGGEVFVTTKETLVKFEDSFFNYLLACKQYEGFYFIDRNPSEFGRILDFLRTGEIIDYTHLSFLQKERLKAEFDFFKLLLPQTITTGLESDLSLAKDYVFSIRSWFPQHTTFKIIYDSNVHGGSVNAFHQACDNKEPYITFAQSEGGLIFGGYADVHSFLFTLKNDISLPPTRFFPTEKACVVTNDTASGPCWGPEDLKFMPKGKTGYYASKLGTHYSTKGAGDNGLKIFIDSNNGYTYQQPLKRLQVFKVELDINGK